MAKSTWVRPEILPNHGLLAPTCSCGCESGGGAGCGQG